MSHILDNDSGGTAETVWAKQFKNQVPHVKTLPKVAIPINRGYTDMVPRAGGGSQRTWNEIKFGS